MNLLYKPNLAEAVARQRLLWTRNLANGILAAMEPEEAPLHDAPTEACRKAPDLAAMLEVWDAWFGRRRELLDDSMPVARVSFGSNAFGGFLGAEVIFGEGGGWSSPILEDWSGLGALRFDEQNEWICRQREACEYFLQHVKGRFALSESETIDGLNLADALRGTTQALLDLYDHPQELHRLMAFGVDFNIKMIEMQRGILGAASTYDGGTFNLHYAWLPGRAVWLSVDAYTLCNSQVLARFGREYLQRLINHFGGGWLHLHARGLHLLPEVVQLERLWGISICDDPGEPRPFEQLEEIRAITDGMPLEIWCHKDELIEGMRSRTLPGNILYRVDEIQSVREANALMEIVRSYRTAE